MQVWVLDNDDVKSGFRVQLHFAENPWFSNTVLEKGVHYDEAGSAEVSAVPPQWYPGKVLPWPALLPCENIYHEDVKQVAEKGAHYDKERSAEVTAVPHRRFPGKVLLSGPVIPEHATRNCSSPAWVGPQ